MKIKFFILGLAISLMSTKCAEKPVNISFENNSERNTLFTFTKNTDSLKRIIFKNYNHDSRYKYLYKSIRKRDTLIESSLNYYLSKDKNFYTFYFLRVIKYDSINNNYVFSNIYDSININKKHFLVGEEYGNIFTYDNDRIVFKSKKTN